MTEEAQQNEWMEAAVTASKEFAGMALGFENTEFIGEVKTIPNDINSALIALVGECTSVQLGICSSTDGCQQLARALLAMEPDEEDLEEEDVADAVGEMANIVAGQIKTLMAQTDSSINLGIPVFVRGAVEVAKETQTSAVELCLGTVPVILLLIMNASAPLEAN